MEKIRKSDSGYSITFSVPAGYTLAVSELSIFPKDAAKDFINESAFNQEQKEYLLNALEASDNIYFYNRLKVPDSVQNKGFGSMLLNETLKCMDENNGFLINTANAYGAKNQEDLIAFYQKRGMVLVHAEGGLVYSPLIKLEKLNELGVEKSTKKNKI